MAGAPRNGGDAPRAVDPSAALTAPAARTDPPQARSAAGVEVDQLSFLVRAQKFRVAASVMRRTPIPLATEYAVRLVHLVPEVTAEEVAAFFGFGAAEARILVQDMLETGLVSEREGRFTLSSRGREAVSDQLDEVELFATDEITAHMAFDLVAFAPVDNVELAGVEARLVREI